MAQETPSSSGISLEVQRTWTNYPTRKSALDKKQFQSITALITTNCLTWLSCCTTSPIRSKTQFCVALELVTTPLWGTCRIICFQTPLWRWWEINRTPTWLGSQRILELKSWPVEDYLEIMNGCQTHTIPSSRQNKTGEKNKSASSNWLAREDLSTSVWTSTSGNITTVSFLRRSQKTTSSHSSILTIHTKPQKKNF